MTFQGRGGPDNLICLFHWQDQRLSLCLFLFGYMPREPRAHTPQDIFLDLQQVLDPHGTDSTC